MPKPSEEKGEKTNQNPASGFTTLPPLLLFITFATPLSSVKRSRVAFFNVLDL
jgi:hypothetical protein